MRRDTMSTEYTGRELNRDAPSAAGRKPSRKTEAVQERILDAAAKVFAEKGYQLAKLSDISDAIDLHVTALRYHFPTKDVLVEEMMNSLVLHVYAQVRASVTGLPETATNRAKIEAASRAYVTSTLEKKDYMSAHGNVLNQVPADLRARHHKLLATTNEFWRGLIADAASAGEIRSDISVSLATQILMGTLIWTREWYRPGLYSPEQLAERFLDVLFGGLAPGRQPAGAGEK